MERKLNATKIRNAKPRDKLYKLTDGGGLYLEVKPNGGKFWRYRYRILGKENVFSLGSLADVSLEGARRQHGDARKLVIKGVHPAHERKAEKERLALESENTFQVIARKWIESASLKNQWSEKYHDQVERTLKLHVFPGIGSKPIASISYEHLEKMLDEVYAVGDRKPAATVAVLLRQWISAIYRFAVRKYGLENDPTPALKDEFKRPRVKHHNPLGKKEVPKFLQKLDAYGGYPETKIALKLLLYVFVRPGELRAARWEEIDWMHKEWCIPADRMKMRQPHTVPLAQQVIILLQDLHKLTGKSDWLFPKQFHKRGAKNKEPFMCSGTMNRALQYMGYGGGEFVSHGFKATASTLLNEMNYRPDWIELQLAHAERNNVRASYNHAMYMSQRKQMMREWADYIDKLKVGEEVIPINQSA